MKKILSLVLVAVLALGMTVTSFAITDADVTITPAGPHTVAAGGTLTLTATAAGATSPTYVWSGTDVTDNNDGTAIVTNNNTSTQDKTVTATVVVTDTDTTTGTAFVSVVLEGAAPVATSVKVTPDEADVVKGNKTTLKAEVLDQDGNALATQPAITWAVAPVGSAVAGKVGVVNGVVTVDKTAKAGDQYKVTATDATNSLSADAIITVTDVTAKKITGFNQTVFAQAADDAVVAKLGASGEIPAGTEIFVKFTPAMFDFDTTSKPDKVTESMLRNYKLTVKSTVSKGSSAVDSVKLTSKDGVAAVKITFVDPYVNTKDTDFDFKVYLLKDKSRLEDTYFSVIGTLKNETIYVDEHDDEVYIGDGRVVEANAYIKSIKVDLGNDFYLTTKMFEGKKYYGVAKNDPEAADDEMLTKHPEIAVIYTIKQKGLNGAVATFDLADKYYVYDKDGKYLGTTADKLAFSEKYYLTTKKVDLTTSDDVDDEDDVTEAPVEDDDDKKPANNNPDTGVNGMVNVAVVAGVVALAAAGAVVLKK